MKTEIKYTENWNAIRYDDDNYGICCRWIDLDGDQVEIEEQFDSVDEMLEYCNKFEEKWMEEENE